MPGTTSEKALAASMTPAPKPNMQSCTRCDRVWEKSAGTAPRAVAPAATMPPAMARATCGQRRSRNSHSW
ncbi:Uncharacterised protein [Bordetella pertussis]|nr:Uncharacterised protein [Bordetella pertussis]CPQ07490.1 Uncharacterised protein [Bordetella pertussis]